eukprot:TRINITY_DN1911_c0_g1_i6.p1 TRINITY_DN1911_c0_g1~~TRINITY_DN1911_c0_g1_i6.p1  ORF type:complete len:145 (-),score=19.10 TRINITY_DN1911_c0_g1_i6:1-435(-)
MEIRHRICKAQLWIPRKRLSLEEREFGFHATKDENAINSILKSGFRMDSSPSIRNKGRYGQGVYVARHSSKSAGYGPIMFAVEIAKGQPQIMNTATKPDLQPHLVLHSFDTVYGDISVTKLDDDEIIAYHPDQVIPRFVIYYEK